MNEPLTGVVLAHAEVAGALVSAVESIAGADHGLVAVSNTGCDRAALTARLTAALAGRPGVVFADMPGGSCAFSAAAFARTHGDVAVVTGVNLAMLLDFAFHRSLTPGEAAARVTLTGKGSITAVGAEPAAQGRGP
jgi:mannose/fructose-specific phosphotransferase system component IIA